MKIKNLLFFSIFILVSCFHVYKGRMTPSAAHQNAIIYRDGQTCVESVKGAEVVLCIVNPNLNSEYAHLKIEIYNKGTQNVTYIPEQVVLQPMVGKPLKKVRPSDYESSARYKRTYAVSSTPTPGEVLRADQALAARLDEAARILRANTLKPTERISGLIIFEGKGFDPGQTLDITISLSPETHQFSFVF